MPQFVLNHTCHKPGCKGEKGQTIEVSEENAAWLEANKGGKRVSDKPAKKAEPVADEALAEPEAGGLVDEPADAPADEANEGTNDANTGDSVETPRKRKRGQ